MEELIYIMMIWEHRKEKKEFIGNMMFAGVMIFIAVILSILF
jgi:hypothetical protein